MDRITGLEGVWINRLIEFVFHRQRDDGAFAASPSLPSTVADTFYALTILKKIDVLYPDQHIFQSINRKKIAAFIWAHESIRNSLPLRIRFFLYAISRLVAGEHASYRDLCDDLDAGGMLNYENYYYLSRLSRDVWKRFRVAELCLDDCTCKDVYYYLLCSAKKDTGLADEIGSWLQRCQNYDGGFGFFPGTTSYIEYCDYSLSALSLVNRQPLHPQQARQYILACRTGAGGFSRSTGAAPFLEASCHAVHSLLCLRDV